jgi:hypothetical protein
LTKPPANLQNLALRALNPYSVPLFHYFYLARCQERGVLFYEHRLETPKQLPLPLYQTASLGHTGLLNLLLNMSHTRINALTGYFGTAFNASAFAGHTSISKKFYSTLERTFSEEIGAIPASWP